VNAPDFIPPLENGCGLHEGLDIERYHAMHPISKTGLDDLNRSPAHYFAWHLDPERPAPPVRAGQLEGNLTHCAVLEPDEFSKRYATVPKGAPRRPTEAQWNAKNPSEDSIASMDWWREFNERTNSATVVTNDQYEVAMRQADSIRALPEIQQFLTKGKSEVSAFWTDPVTSVECRCRPDWVYQASRSSVVLLDLKTFSSAAPDEFRRQCARKRYHVQDTFYSGGFSQAAGVDVEKFIFVVVETEWPYAAASYVLGNESREEGYLECRRLLDIYEECLRTKKWPGYADKTTQIDLPPYAFTSQEVEISYV
jgi:exodeoxyribonuclease VIII